MTSEQIEVWLAHFGNNPHTFPVFFQIHTVKLLPNKKLDLLLAAVGTV
jgi:hypothetical protein